MTAPVRALARADGRALIRDPLLRAMLLAPIALVGLLMIGVPLVEGWLADSYGLDAAPHRRVVVAFLLGVIMPLLFGAFAGLLLLEDRESGALSAIAVSVAGVRNYLAVRCAWAATAAGVATGGALLLEGVMGVWHSLLVAALAGGAATVVALLIGGFATDRLEGMAVTKVMTLPLAGSLLLWPLGFPRGWTLALLPTFGPVAVIHQADTGGPLVASVAAGAITTILWLGYLTRRIVRRPH